MKPTNPTALGQATVERAVYHLLDSLQYEADPAAAVRSVMVRLCDGDRTAKRDMYSLLNGLGKTLGSLMDETDRLQYAYTDAGYELKDNPESLSLLRKQVGAGSNGVGLVPPHFVANLPPAARAHLLRAHDRKRHLPTLSSAAVVERTAQEHVACAMVEEAMPLVRLGNKGYETEIGGES